MNTRKSRSSPRLRLVVLLAGLASINLAKYDTEQEPKCNCSRYQGRMEITPEYVSIEEGRTGFVRASFPENVQWSISRAPSPDVVAEYSGVDEGSGTFRVDVTAVEAVVNPDAIDFYLQRRPARRTHLEIMARPETAAIERRLVTVLALIPMISGSFPIEIFGDPSLPTQDFELSWQVRIETGGDWNFEIDVSNAPSLQAPSSVVKLSSNSAAVELPYADRIRWTGFFLATPSLCQAMEPVHVTATSEDRVLRSTVAVNIFGYPGRFGILDCPQPSDFRQ